MSSKSEVRSLQFTECVGRYQPRLLGLARKLCCKGGVEPEDLVQDTLERALHHFDQLRARSEASRLSWLYTTLQRCFIDAYRRCRLELQDGPELEVLRAPVIVREPRVWRPWEHFSTEDLQHAVARLEPTLRAAFELHAAGLRYKAIARRLGTPVGTVGYWLHKARIEVRTQLQALARCGDAIQTFGEEKGPSGRKLTSGRCRSTSR